MISVIQIPHTALYNCGLKVTRYGVNGASRTRFYWSPELRVDPAAGKAHIEYVAGTASWNVLLCLSSLSRPDALCVLGSIGVVQSALRQTLGGDNRMKIHLQLADSQPNIVRDLLNLQRALHSKFDISTESTDIFEQTAALYRPAEKEVSLDFATHDHTSGD